MEYYVGVDGGAEGKSEKKSNKMELIRGWLGGMRCLRVYTVRQPAASNYTKRGIECNINSTEEAEEAYKDCNTYRPCCKAVVIEQGCRIT